MNIMTTHQTKRRIKRIVKDAIVSRIKADKMLTASEGYALAAQFTVDGKGFVPQVELAWENLLRGGAFDKLDIIDAEYVAGFGAAFERIRSKKKDFINECENLSASLVGFTNHYLAKLDEE